MREIVILSGKGGTGKTTITASLIASFIGENIITVDADVDAPNLHIYTGIIKEKEEHFSGGIVAEIIPDKCTGCGKCYEFCSFGAIFPTEDGLYEVNPLFCEGCGMCPYVCDDEAININDTSTGKIITAKNNFGHRFYMAELMPGKENTGKMVTEIKKKAKEENPDAQVFIVDGPPGIGCPVIATLSGATDLIIVAESTPSGMADVRRLVELSENFGLKKYIIINKTGLSKEVDDEIVNLANKNNLNILTTFKFDKRFQNAAIRKALIYDYMPETKKIFDNIWKELLKEV